MPECTITDMQPFSYQTILTANATLCGDIQHSRDSFCDLKGKLKLVPFTPYSLVRTGFLTAYQTK